MSARLPIPGQDDGTWGNILNQFLEVSHNGDGTLTTAALQQAGAVISVNGQSPSSGAVTLSPSDIGAGTYSKPSGGIPASDLTNAVQTDLTLAGTSVQLGGDLGGTTTTPTVSKLQGTTVNAASPTTNQVLAYNGSQWVPATATSTTVNDATSSAPGIIQLDGDLGGTATTPTVTSTHLASALPVNQGGTGATTQNFVDLSSTQTIGGAKTFSSSVGMSSQKITGLANGSVSTDAAAFGQIPTAGTGSTNFTAGNATVGGDLTGTLPNPTVAKVNGITLPGSAPSGSGQVLTSTSTSATAWTTPAAGVTLDGTVGDIQPDTTTGTAVVGSTGKAADAGHQHTLVSHNHTTANLGGQIPVGGLNATGSASSTTFLRGDGSWQTPAGASNATSSTPGLIQLDGDLGGTATSPTVAKIQGVAISGTPASGQAILATGTTAASWSAIPGTTDWINVVTKGADPTGVNDATTIIQNALTNANAGQPVYLPAGIYKTSAPIEIPPGGVLMGDLANEVSETQIGAWGSILQPSSSWAQGSAPANAVVLFLGQSDGGYSLTADEQKLYGIMIDCENLSGSTTTDGIQFYGSVARAHLERVLVMRAPGNGVNCVTDTGGGSADALRFVRVNVRYPGNYGFNHYKISDCTYIDCLVENSVSDGYNITNASNGTFIGCRSEHSGGNGYTYTCTNSATGSGGTRFVGCSTDNSTAYGIKVTSTNGSGIPLQLTGCTFRRDGYNAGSGGGGYAGIYVTGYPGTVQVSGCAVWPGVEDNGSGPNIPQNGMVLASNSASTYVIVGTSYIQGATTAISDDGSAGGVYYGMDVLGATGTTSSPAVQGPRFGQATLASGSVTVACTSVTTTSKIFLTSTTFTNPGFLRISARSAGTNFTVSSSSTSDASSFFWQILNP